MVFAPIIQQPLAGHRQLVAERRRVEWLASLLAFEPMPITLERTSVEDVDTAECAED